MTKLFFFDIDNTLLDHKTNEIPASALQAITDLKQAGHVVAVATGRSLAHAKEFLEIISPIYAVLQNGAFILRGEHVIDKAPLAHEALMRLFELMERRGFYYGINGEEGGHVSAEVDHVMVPLDSVDIEVHSDIEHFRQAEVLQGWLFFDEALDAEFVPELKTLFPEFDFVRWHQTAVDVLPKGVNKLTGCQHVLRDAGISIDHAYAFGDGLNDMEMLQGVGVGIAMGNAHPNLKAVADRVTDAVGEHGVANMVKQIQAELA